MPATPTRRLERLIVTRPAPEAQAWAQWLGERGWPAHALPLIEIREPTAEADRAQLQHWRAHWAQADAILFVSGAAVRHFFAGDLAAAGPTARTRFWAPGPSTARELGTALKRLGLDEQRVDAPAEDAEQFDSEHLWPRVRAQVGPGRLVLIVRGSSAASPSTATPGVAGHGRDWLIQQCLAAGARVEGCVAYARREPPLSSVDEAVIRSAASAGSAWLFSSSEALAPLRRLAPAPDWSAASALVTHPRIGEAARAAGFGHVASTRPAFPDVLRTLESGWNRP